MTRRVYRRSIVGDTIQSLQVQKPLDELRPRNIRRYFLLRDATQLLYVRKNPPLTSSSAPSQEEKLKIAHLEHSECPASPEHSDALFLSFLQRWLTFSRLATPVSFPPQACTGTCYNLPQSESMMHFSSFGYFDIRTFSFEFCTIFKLKIPLFTEICLPEPVPWQLPGRPLPILAWDSTANSSRFARGGSNGSIKFSSSCCSALWNPALPWSPLPALPKLGKRSLTGTCATGGQFGWARSEPGTSPAESNPTQTTPWPRERDGEGK